MFLIRLLLRLVMLLFLGVSLTMAWTGTEWLTRIILIVISLLLILGIYALRHLRSMEEISSASNSLPVNAWQLMWSRQTPFFLPQNHQSASYEVNSRKLDFNRLAPGFHIVAARLLPIAASTVALWLISDAASRYWEWLGPWLLQVSSLKQADLSAIFFTLGAAFFLAFYALVQNQFMAHIPARCLSPGCAGHAFLATEANLRKNWGRRNYQFVYLCREHGHRHPTGVECIRVLHTGT